MLKVEIHMTGEQVVLTDRQEEHMTALAREIIDPSWHWRGTMDNPSR
jgi:hypothetical protein